MLKHTHTMIQRACPKGRWSKYERGKHTLLSLPQLVWEAPKPIAALLPTTSRRQAPMPEAPREPRHRLWWTQVVAAWSLLCSCSAESPELGVPLGILQAVTTLPRSESMGSRSQSHQNEAGRGLTPHRGP